MRHSETTVAAFFGECGGQDGCSTGVPDLKSCTSQGADDVDVLVTG